LLHFVEYGRKYILDNEFDKFKKAISEQADVLKKLNITNNSFGISVPKEIAMIGKSLNSQKELLKNLSFPDSVHEYKPLIVPKIKSFEENNEFQSAGILLKKLADSMLLWRQSIPDNYQPVVIAILNGNIQINVDRLSEESFHGIRVEGKLNGAPCMLLAHQATIQLLCLLQEICPPETPKRQIGFIINGQESKV
jgi:hypothetical protein